MQQQQQQPPPQSQSLNSGPPPPHFSSNSITTEQIQKYLDENRNLILAIMENQNLGKLAECGQLQNVLQKNLMYLAAIADAQPPPSGPPQVAPNSVAQQGNYMQQPQGGGAILPQQPQGGGAILQQQPQGGGAMLQQQPQGGGAMLPQQPQGGGAMLQQQSQGGGVPKLPFQINALRPQDQKQQQLLHFQQQQQMHSQMGYRPGANNGMHGMHQAMQHGLGTSGGLMDIRGNKHEGSEAVTGDGQGKSASGRVGSANRES